MTTTSRVLIANVSRALVVDARTRIQRGKYALRIRPPLLAIAFIAVVVASVKKVHATMAISSWTGKSGVVAPAFNRTLKTRYMIPNSISGLISDQT